MPPARNIPGQAYQVRHDGFGYLDARLISASGGFEVDPSGMTSGRATTESLGLDKATAIQFAVAVNWKKWNFGFTYLPITFTGEGYTEERF